MTSPDDWVDVYYWPTRGRNVGWRPREPQATLRRRVAEQWSVSLTHHGDIAVRIVPSTKKRD